MAVKIEINVEASTLDQALVALRKLHAEIQRDTRDGIVGGAFVGPADAPHGNYILRREEGKE